MGLSEQQKAHVRKQVDFYFSDSNLPYDKFLFEQTQNADNGWLDLSVIVAFKRMQGILKKEFKSPDDVDSEDIEAVAALLKDSDTVEISEDGFQIRRKNMPTDWDAVKAAVDARSIYVEPLPYNETIESIGSIFAGHGAVNQVRLIRVIDPEVKGGVFAGSAIIEMASLESAQKLLDANIEHEGVSLRIQSKQAYQQARAAAGLKEGDRGERTNCPVVTAEGLPEEPPCARDSSDHAAADKAETASEPLEEGCILKFEIHGDVPEAMPQGRQLRSLLDTEDKGLAYVGYNPQANPREGQLRFNSKEHADKCLAKCDADGVCKIQLEDDGGELAMKMEALTGDAEQQAWRAWRTAQAQRDAADAAAGRNGKRRGGGAPRGGAKRGRS